MEVWCKKIYCIYIMINIYFRVCVRIFNRWNEIYRCKPTSSCKSCKLQSEPPDQHPRGGAEGVEGGICKCVITQSKGGRLIVKLPNPHMLLGCWSSGPNWSLHCLLSLHLICSLDEKGVRYIIIIIDFILILVLISPCGSTGW